LTRICGRRLRETFVSVQRPLANLTPNLLTSHGGQPPPSSPEVSPPSSPQRSRRSVSLVSAGSRNAIHLESVRSPPPTPSLRSRSADALRRHVCTHACMHSGHTRTHTRARVRACVCVYIYACMWKTRARVCVYACVTDRALKHAVTRGVTSGVRR